MFPDRRDPTRVLHSLADMFRSRMFAICCGYEFNAHYDERCFLPIHVYDTEKSRPVAVVLRGTR